MNSIKLEDDLYHVNAILLDQTAAPIKPQNETAENCGIWPRLHCKRPEELVYPKTRSLSSLNDEINETQNIADILNDEDVQVLMFNGSNMSIALSPSNYTTADGHENKSSTWKSAYFKHLSAFDRYWIEERNRKTEKLFLETSQLIRGIVEEKHSNTQSSIWNNLRQIVGAIISSSPNEIDFQLCDNESIYFALNFSQIFMSIDYYFFSSDVDSEMDDIDLYIAKMHNDELIMDWGGDVQDGIFILNKYLPSKIEKKETKFIVSR